MERVDLNIAGESELASLPGLDRERARTLIEHRPFRSWDEIDALEGFGAEALSGLRAAAVLGHPDRTEPDSAELAEAPGDITEAPEEDGRSSSWF